MVANANVIVVLLARNREFRIIFFGTQASKTQVRLENEAGTQHFFNLSPR